MVSQVILGGNRRGDLGLLLLSRHTFQTDLKMIANPLRPKQFLSNTPVCNQPSRAVDLVSRHALALGFVAITGANVQRLIFRLHITTKSTDGLACATRWLTTRFVLLAFGALCWLICQSSVLLATPPDGLITLPDGPIPFEPLTNRNPAALKAFQNMIQGTPGTVATDPVMAGLMQVFHHRGSLLNNSSLGPKLNRQDETQTPKLVRSQESLHNRKRIRAAELLLKTSRMIDEIEPQTENQQKLVIQMRQEAVRLMTRQTR